MGAGGLGWVVWTGRLGPGPFNNKSLAKYFCSFVSCYMYFNVLLRLLWSLTAHSLTFYCSLSSDPVSLPGIYKNWVTPLSSTSQRFFTANNFLYQGVFYMG